MSDLDSGALFRGGYPEAPGHRRSDTSSAAAASIAPTAALLRGRCLDVLRRAPATADEVAKALGESVLSIRPRITELKSDGSIRDTGQRRKNKSGRSAAVWEVGA